MSAGRISICTAGDLRVHATWEGQLHEVTRDHTYEQDPEFQSAKETVPERMRAGVVTRSIGDGARVGPDDYVWDVPPDFTLIVCSAQIHQHRPPETYFESLLRRDVDNRRDMGGFVCWVETKTVGL
jgi:serine/threonine protein phosphatase PrpC